MCRTPAALALPSSSVPPVMWADQDRDGIDRQLRVGLNSGQVIAGGIGSGALGYTAVGEQVGIAQRMESVAPPGRVMLSASTARLVDGAAALGEPEAVQIKGADEPVAAQRLLGVGDQHRRVGRAESNLVGRRWEMAAVEGLLDRAVEGQGAVVTAVGSPGIGKSRLVREVIALAAARRVEVFSTFCESHATDVPFRVVARLLRAVGQVSGLDAQSARARVRALILDADPEDVLLLDDLMGIADPDVELPRIDPDARRRRCPKRAQSTRPGREMGLSPAITGVERGELEPSGDDPKLWFYAPDDSPLSGHWMFKPRKIRSLLPTEARRLAGATPKILVGGQDWSEKMAYELARAVHVPAAITQLAVFSPPDGNPERGAISRDMRPWTGNASPAHNSWMSLTKVSIREPHVVIHQPLYKPHFAPCVVRWERSMSCGRHTTCSSATCCWMPGSPTPTATRSTGRFCKSPKAHCV
jgi:hypothetical protein